MKKTILVFMVSIFCGMVLAQNKSGLITISFENDYKDVFHLSLIIYTPDGKGITRVSNVDPAQIKKYEFPEGTEIFIADNKQEAYAMKGNDVKATGIQPYIVLKSTDNNKLIKLSSISPSQKATISTEKKPDPNAPLGTWVIDLRLTPDSKPYLKDFVFTKIEGRNFEG